jgi:hypothetical protein
VRLFIDAAGTPYAVESVECHELFVGSASEAALKWRFYPLRQDPEPQTFELAIQYKLAQ